MTPYKVHRKDLVKSSPFKKYPIHQKEITNSRGSKLQYKGPDNFYTESSYDKENIENYKIMDELSTKDKEDSEDPE